MCGLWTVGSATTRTADDFFSKEHSIHESDSTKMCDLHHHAT